MSRLAIPTRDTSRSALSSSRKLSRSSSINRPTELPSNSQVRNLPLPPHPLPSLSVGQEPLASPPSVPTPSTELNPITCELSFQSRVGPVEWLRPYTDQKIEEMGSRGVKNLIVVPISFVSEHIETLEEIDMEYKSHLPTSLLSQHSQDSGFGVRNQTLGACLSVEFKSPVCSPVIIGLSSPTS
jgi:hypothetical protein